MNDGSNNQENDDDSNAVRVKGPFGIGIDVSKDAFERTAPEIKRWIVPAIAICIGILCLFWGVAQVIYAIKGAAQ